MTQELLRKRTPARSLVQFRSKPSGIEALPHIFHTAFLDQGTLWLMEHYAPDGDPGKAASTPAGKALVDQGIVTNDALATMMSHVAIARHVVMQASASVQDVDASADLHDSTIAALLGFVLETGFVFEADDLAVAAKRWDVEDIVSWIYDQVPSKHRPFKVFLEPMITVTDFPDEVAWGDAPPTEFHVPVTYYHYRAAVGSLPADLADVAPQVAVPRQ